MNKYDKLIKELRSCRDKAVFSDYWWDITWRAANAIEELTNSLERYRALLSHEQKINAERAEFYRNLSVAHTGEIQAALSDTPTPKPFGNGLDGNYRYCHFCGQRIDWSE